MHLLELVNDLRHLLRENTVTSAVGSSPDLTVQVRLINRAARRVLSRRSWTFLHRDDGYLFFPGRVQASLNVAGAGTSGSFATSGANLQRFSDGVLAAKVLIPGSEFPQTSVHVQSISATSTVLTFATNARVTGLVTYPLSSLYANEAALPEKVARVLSIRNEEGAPVRFETIDSFDDFDRRFPRDSERFAERPEVVSIGGQVVTTERTVVGVVTVPSVPGVGARVYPPPSSDVHLRYSYVLRHPDLTEDDDHLVGVPSEVLQHIVRVAFEEALISNIEDDPSRGERMRIQNELDYRNLVGADTPDAGRRMVPRPFSSHAGGPGMRCVARDSLQEP